jgi:hypothetical protein
MAEAAAGIRKVFPVTVTNNKKMKPSVPANVMVEVHRTGVDILERKPKVR